MSFGFGFRNTIRRSLPKLALDFTNGVLPVGSTYTGNGGLGTQVNTSGTVVQSVADTARFDYNGVTLASRGVLVEPARTNLALRSGEIDNVVWSKGASAVVTANGAAGPTGAIEMDLLKPPAFNNESYTQQQVAGAVGTYTASWFCRAGGYSWVALSIYDSAHHRAWFNLATGTVGTVQSGVTAAIEDWGGGLYRCSITFLTTTINPYINATVSNADGVSIFTADGVNGVYLFGGQIELGVSASTYIPTVAATVTRTADALAFTVPAGVSSLRYVFDDGSTQDVAAASGAYIVPTTLNRARIKRIRGL